VGAIDIELPLAREGPFAHDHLEADDLPLDGFVALGSLTRRRGATALGCLAAVGGGAPFSLLAKYLATLDLCSGGRAQMTLSAGSRGTPTMLVEAFEVVSRLLTEGAPTLSGETLAVHEAWNEPEPEHPLSLGLHVRDDEELRAVAGMSPRPSFLFLEGVPGDSLAVASRLSGARSRRPELYGVIRSVAPEIVRRSARQLLETGCDGAVCALSPGTASETIEAVLEEAAR
jgi:hypothetical protein